MKLLIVTPDKAQFVEYTGQTEIEVRDFSPLPSIFNEDNDTMEGDTLWDYLDLPLKQRRVVDAYLSDVPNALGTLSIYDIIDRLLDSYDSLGSLACDVLNFEEVPNNLWDYIDEKKFVNDRLQEYHIVEHENRWYWFKK